MEHNDHKLQPEIWLRPSPRLSLETLLAYVGERRITATPRLGARNGDHPKGYEPGNVAILRVLDDAGVEHFSTRIHIKQFPIRPLQELTEADLLDTLVYQDWHEVQNDLSFFEKRAIASDESASVVEFSYL